ncbi:nucleotidyltransferase family protein [Arthrobacter psychrolactophilus]|nr:nucleotidyltransferase family protein [Arthrobacter psychrolactophilus]
MSDTNSERLSSVEATKLAAVLCQRLALRRSVPLLAIKGDAFMALGIRPLRPASDLDVLVSPSFHKQFCADLEGSGWELRSDDLGGHYANHSSTYFNSQWPVDIDVHHRFPGFSGDTQKTFDLLWEQKQTVKIANQDIITVSELDARIIQALNCLRNPWKPLDQAEFHFLIENTADHLANQLSDRGIALSCLAEIRPFLLSLDPNLDLIDWPQESAEWRAQKISSSVGALRIIDIIESPFKDKVRLIKSAMFPSTRSLISKSMGEFTMDSNIWAKLNLGWKRCRQFIKDAPKTFTALRRYYGRSK